MKTEERKKDTKKLNLKIIITLCNLAISVGMMSECIKAITNSDPWGLSAAFGIVLMIPFIYLFIYSIIQIKNIFKKKIEITTIDKIIITLCNLVISAGMTVSYIEEVLHPDAMGINAFLSILPLVLSITLFIYSIIQIKNIFKKKIEITTIDTITSIYYTIFFISFILKML